MANELTVSASIRYTKSGVSVNTDDFGASGVQIDVSGSEYLEGIQVVGTTEEAQLVGSDMATPGYVLLKNLDSTNFVKVRAASGGTDVIKLKAGEVAMFRLAATGPYMIADTASCRVRYLIIED